MPSEQVLTISVESIRAHARDLTARIHALSSEIDALDRKAPGYQGELARLGAQGRDLALEAARLKLFKTSNITIDRSRA